MQEISTESAPAVDETVNLLQEGSPVEPTGEETPPEVEPKPVVTEAEQKFAAKFAALSRKEKQVRQQEAQLQKQMAEMQAKLAAFEASQAEFGTFKELPNRLKSNPIEVLREQGITDEHLAQLLMNNGQPTEDMKFQQVEQKMLSKLEELQAKIDKKEADEAQAREAQAIEAFQAQLTDFVNKDETYELIKAHDAVDMVFEVIKQHHDENDGAILSNAEACNVVEEYLLEQAKKLIDREKVKKLLQPAPTPTKAGALNGKAAPTLSNAQAAQASNKTVARKLTNEESIAEAAKLIKWEE